MMKILWIKQAMLVGVVLGGALAASPAEAQQDVRISFSPRFWYLFDNFSTGSLKQGAGTTFLETAEEGWAVPLFGASLSVVHPALPNTSFNLTGLYGTASNTGRLVGSQVLPGNQLLQVTENVSSQTLNRTDVELTAQTAFGQNLAWTVGARYERVRIDYGDVLFTLTTAGAGTPPTRTQLVEPLKDGYDLYSVRGGIVGVLRIDDAGRHRLYTQFQGFVGYRDPVIASRNRFDEAWYIGPDMSVGYQLALNETIGLDLRYRMLAFFPLSGANSFNDARSTHGLVLSANFSF